MEARCNALIFIGILATIASLRAGAPSPSLDPAAPGTSALADLEDAFASQPANATLARQLAEAYLDLEQPGLAVAVLRSGDASLMDDPIVAHRMAQAYEATGRVLDAYATAQYARNHCARLLETGGESPSTCNAHELAVLDVHSRVLQTMVAWGVSDPLRDPRTALAYQSQMRLATVAMAGR